MENLTLYDEMKHLIDHIETNLLDIQTIDECLNETHFSKYHVLHTFKQLTDTTIMSYVVKRRLTESLKDLIHTNHRIIDIALKYGFSHEQSYNRAFKKLFNQTPNQYRKHPNNKEIIIPTSIRQFFQTDNGILINPIYIRRPQMLFVGEQYNIKGNESYTKGTAKNLGYDFFYSRSQLIKQSNTPKVYYGITWHENKDYNNSIYMPSLEVSDFENIPEEMSKKIVPPSNYAVFTYVGNHSIEALTLHDFLHIHDFAESNFHDAHLIYNEPFFFERIDAEKATDQHVEVEIWFRLLD